MATQFNPLNATDALKFINNYSNADKTTIGNKFGEKVKKHFSLKAKNTESFRTKSLSFDPSRNDIHGLAGLKIVITDLDGTTVVLPPLTGENNRYIIFLGLDDTENRVDILNIAKRAGGQLTSSNEYYKIVSENVNYETIIASAELADKNLAIYSFEYSWHCAPDCY